MIGFDMGFLSALSVMLATFLPESALVTVPQQSASPAVEEVASEPQPAPSALEPVPVQDVDIAPVQNISEPQQPQLPLVFADKSDEELIAMAVSYLESVDTLRGRFYQQAPSGTLSTGKFYIRRPGLLRFEYDPPTPLLIVANGGTVFVRDDALKTTDSYPVGRTPLKFLLRKKIDLDEADIINVERGSDAIALTLSARDEETEGELSLVFSAPEIGLARWVVRDARNGLTIVDLVDVERDEKLPNDLFRIPETISPFLKN